MICIARAMAEQWGGILTEKDGEEQKRDTDRKGVRIKKGSGSKRGI